jgi:hypothetical protein
MFEYAHGQADVEDLETNVDLLSEDSPYGQLLEGANLILRGRMAHGLVAKVTQRQGDYTNRPLSENQPELLDERSGSYTIY